MGIVCSYEDLLIAYCSDHLESPNKRDDSTVLVDRDRFKDNTCGNEEVAASGDECRNVRASIIVQLQ